MRPTSGEARHRCARYLRLVGIGIDVRSWHLADIPPALTNVGFEGKNGHDAGVTRCLLMIQSRHVTRGLLAWGPSSFLPSCVLSVLS